MTRRLRAAMATIGLACALLVAACQGDDPDPAPTAVLPTPAPPGSPSSSASESSDENVAIEDAAEVYVEGRERAEELLVAGEYDNAEEALSKYFSGSYLSYWKAEFDEFEQEKWTTAGAVNFTVVDADEYQRESETSQSVAIYACVDFRDATTQSANGDPIDRGYDFSLDRVEMVKNGRTWKADVLDSLPLEDPLTETPCADTFV